MAEMQMEIAALFRSFTKILYMINALDKIAITIGVQQLQIMILIKNGEIV